VLETAGLENLLAGAKRKDRSQSRLRDVGCVLGTQRLGEDITDADGLHDGADRLAADQSGTLAGRAEEDLGEKIYFGCLQKASF